MADELRRDFIKRAGIAATVIAGSVVATAATTQSQSRGAGNDTGSGVVTGRSKKKEILYKKTAAWNEFYGAAK
ncbi:twin-arginine translocation signal domain-containing protein [Arcobacter caeni]|uniref:Formate dehydrogenase n=1 Tax=Arcobacter caeni TaxID=1912877 RepID=A0A363D5L0_9BACT|nr:twin-arginine translocation signal domain-containing protein [Arcobacter caeni]PUE66553.1 formate dehydrogenase [Arcobacter caeni]